MTQTTSQTVNKTEEQNELIAQTLRKNGYELVSEGKDCIVQYVWKLKGSEHILFLWEKEENRDMIVQELFSSEHRGESTALFSVVPRNMPLVKNMTYGDFFHTHKDEFLERAVDKVSRAVSMNHDEKSTRSAFEDDTWLMARGLEDKVLSTEEMLGKQVDPKLSLFCMDQRRNLKDVTLVKLIAAHGYVLLDEPAFRLFKWGGIQGE
ncbi:MAG TPA: hypothetical protein VJ742_04250 [Nitrososphaera sp.]|nr:hypothetical protein [Nitrososphaera sp.]